jgi:hypothetical protein
MIDRSVKPDLHELRQLYHDAFRYYEPARDVPSIQVVFYPYIGINHTIRVRGGTIYVRLAEICSDMPMEAHRGLALLLVGKLRNKKIPVRDRRAYSDHIRSPEMQSRAADSRRERGRKVVTTTIGTVYDLDEIFDQINEQYFRGAVPKPTLTWSSQKTFRILGHHDRVHDHITISRSLDSHKVPRFVVEYVVFHEMLHIVHPTRVKNGRRYHHTAEFRRDERNFPQFDAADKWIENNIRMLKRESKR